MSDDISVARARIEEVQPLAVEYKRSNASTEPPLPSGALFWLARDDQRQGGTGQPMGYAAGTLRPEGLVLGPVYVRDSFRRRGVALRLLREIERWASGARIPLVEVSVAVDNEAGRKFLEAAGYSVRRVLMSRDGDQR
jgi:GNAT superfamily N-acetyltransferase